MFAVIEIFTHDYEPSGAKCIASFPTREEAERYVQGVYDEIEWSRRVRRDYVTAYVERLRSEYENQQEWISFLRRIWNYGPWISCAEKSDTHVVSYFSQHEPGILDDFNPPEDPEDVRWFLMEVPPCE